MSNLDKLIKEASLNLDDEQIKFELAKELVRNNFLKKETRLLIEHKNPSGESIALLLDGEYDIVIEQNTEEDYSYDDGTGIVRKPVPVLFINRELLRFETEQERNQMYDRVLDFMRKQ